MAKDKNWLKEETKHGVLAIACFAASLFFLLASWHQAGAAGDSLFAALRQLFGTGFFAIPLVLFFLGVSFFQSIRPDFILYRFIAGGLFFIAVLVLISLVPTGDPSDWLDGGWIGELLARPLTKLFGFYSLIFLAAIMIACLFVIFDARPSFARFSPLLGRVIQRLRSNKNRPFVEEYSGAAATPAVHLEEKDRKAKLAEKPDKGEEDFSSFSVISRASAKVGKREFMPPPLSLLEEDSGRPGAGDVKGNANIIKRTLANFGIVVEMDEVSIGPSITRYALKPAEGVKLSRIVALQNDLSLALAAHPLRIEAPIPGKSLVGIEIPNSHKATVGLASLLAGAEFANAAPPLLVSLGRGITGNARFSDLGRAPHVLVAGATGAGKSVVIHTFVTSLLYRNPPERLRFIMIDPKRVELTLYNRIPHLLTPVITDAKKSILALKWAIREMERRYNVLERSAVRDVSSYHKNFGQDEEAEKMPYIVIIFDELADVMSAYPRELESAIVRLAQMSRAVGIHLVLSTQRPSVDVITGLIKANIPTRVALQVSSQIDSRTILDGAGAEKLLGAGDMLYLAGDMTKPVRLQSAFISENEVKKVTGWLAKHYQDNAAEEIILGMEKEAPSSAGWENASADEDDDELYEETRELVVNAGKASASYLQRKLKVGYARAARLLDLLEERGVIGPGDGAKQREVYQKPANHDGSALPAGS